MKQISLIISFLAFVLIVNAQVTKPRVFIEDFKFDNDGINVHYAFENCNDNDRFLIWIEAHTESGKIYKAKSLLGDVENVIPVGKHRVIWFTGKDGVIIEEKITLKIFASAMPNPKMSKAFMASTIFPGAGHKYAGGKHNKLYLGAVGYAGIATGVLMSGQSLAAYNSYASATSSATATGLLADAQAYQTMAISSFAISAGIWALDYFLLNKTAKKSKKITPAEMKIDPYTKPFLIAESHQQYISTRGYPPNIFAELSFTDDNKNGILEAEEDAKLMIKLINKGIGNAYDLKINIKDNNTDKSFKIEIPENITMLKSKDFKTIEIPISSDIDIKTLEHKLQIDVNEKFGYDMDPAYLVLQTFEYQKAKLVFSGFEILDTGIGTAAITEDGQLQAGEMVKLKLVVQNSGQGIAENVKFAIKTDDSNIFMRDNNGELGTLHAGEVKEVYLTLSPNKRVLTKDNLPLFLTLNEEKGKGDLLAFNLPIKMNQKAPKTNIVTLNKDIESLTKNIARFEFSSKKFSSKVSNLINISSVLPSKTKRKNAIAVVFGVADYQNMAPAPYADKDAELMKEYFEKVLGINQVISFINEEVTIGNFHKVFSPDYGEIKKVVTPETEVFVFYSGHGIPDKSGKDVYLFPYDGIKEDLATFGYNINTLYENLNKLGAKKVTVILDACFSGSSRKSESIKEQNLIAQKGVKIKMTKPWLNNSNFTMISSSTGEETSLGLDDSQTGLFTYYLCAALQGKADENGDKKITFGELKKYVKTNVVSHSTKIAGAQTPEFNGNDDDVWVEW